MLDRLLTALVITKREVRDQFRDWRILFPVLGLTVFFPFIMNFTAKQILDFVQKYGASVIGERLVPFLLMIVGFFPISVSLVIALETFVGEKERGSIEPLLNSPLRDWQLYLGKLLSAVVPPLLSSFLGMAVYLAGLVYNHVPLPEPKLLLQIVVLTSVQAVMMVSGAVVVSTQATSVRAANLLASFIVIPVAFLIQGESVVMFWGDYGTLWWAVFGLVVLTILLVRVGLAHFQREELLGREIDVLNLRWAGGVMKRTFTGGAGSILDWYRRVIPRTVKGLAWPFLLCAMVAAASIFIGSGQVERFQIPINQSGVDNLGSRLQLLLRNMPLISLGPVTAIWWQNVRVLLLAMILGVFSFGIMGMLPMIATLGVVGYLMRLLQVNGLPPTQYFLAFILPHGIIEIPVVILATAAVLKAGARLATPSYTNTIGEVWLSSLADWAKIMVGLVIPLLLVAAAIEAWVTPRLGLLIIK